MRRTVRVLELEQGRVGERNNHKPYLNGEISAPFMAVKLLYNFASRWSGFIALNVVVICLVCYTASSIMLNIELGNGDTRMKNESFHPGTMH